MSPRSSMIPLVAALLFASTPAFAQNLQNWETNQQNQIQQDANSGLLNLNQTQHLQSREAQIQAQQQAYMNQNGGMLTVGEQHKIQHELSDVNHQIGHDVHHNAGNYPVNYAPGSYYTPVNYMNGNPAHWQNYNGYQPQNYHGNWGYRHNWGNNNGNNGWH